MQRNLMIDASNRCHALVHSTICNEEGPSVIFIFTGANTSDSECFICLILADGWTIKSDVESPVKSDAAFTRPFFASRGVSKARNGQ